jgi:hypothetical protein
MAATYYSQILHMFYWDNISKGMDYVAKAYRELKEKPGDGFDCSSFGIHFWAGKDMWSDEDDFKVTLYIGSSLNLVPSGKFYMPWSTNITAKEAEKDERFWDAFDKVVAKFNLFVESGEGDPLDTYLGRSYNVSS